MWLSQATSLGFKLITLFTDPYDIVNSTVIALIPRGRSKLTCFWSHRDQAIIWDYMSLSNDPSKLAINPVIAAVGMENNSPPILTADVYVDIRCVRWGYNSPPSASVKKSIIELMAERRKEHEQDEASTSSSDSS